MSRYSILINKKKKKSFKFFNLKNKKKKKSFKFFNLKKYLLIIFFNDGLLILTGTIIAMIIGAVVAVYL